MPATTSSAVRVVPSKTVTCPPEASLMKALCVPGSTTTPRAPAGTGKVPIATGVAGKPSMTVVLDPPRLAVNTLWVASSTAIPAGPGPVGMVAMTKGGSLRC